MVPFSMARSRGCILPVLTCPETRYRIRLSTKDYILIQIFVSYPVLMFVLITWGLSDKNGMIGFFVPAAVCYYFRSKALVEHDDILFIFNQTY